MHYKLLGQSGLRVSELALGTMTFGEDWGWGCSKEESAKIFNAYAEAGGNFIDTACNYTEGTSEKYVGEFVAKDRDAFVVATKYTLRPRGANQDDPNAGGNHLKNLRRMVEVSLRRLNTEYIDLLYLHMWDYTTPVEEVMRGMDCLVRAGKVLYVGLSDTPAYIISKANMYAKWQGLSPIVSTQLPYSLADRAPERDLLPMAKEEDVAVTAWGLLEGGVLTGKYRNSDGSTRYDGASESEMRLGDAVVAIAKEIGCSPAQVAINWVRQQDHRAQIIPILGARTEAQIQDNLGVLNFELSQAQLRKVEELSSFQLGFPRGFLTSPNVLGLVHGNTHEMIVNHRI